MEPNEHDAPTKDRLDRLQADIDRTRQEIEEHGTIPPADDPRTFIDPDGDGEADEGAGAIGGL